MKDSIILKGVYRGRVAQRYGFETAIDKVSVDENLYLSWEGLDGDACADRRHHGGRERALHQYPFEHYAYWQQKYGPEHQWIAPGMGENLSTEGMLEENVCLGDRYRWGEAIIEVSQPRSPCYKLNQRWGIDRFSVEMQAFSRCGWLYRVIQPGRVSMQDALMLVEREGNALSILQVCEWFFCDPLNEAALHRLRQQTRLSDSWMSKVVQRLETQTVENWNFRLFG